jgi:hypothetical protein
MVRILMLDLGDTLANDHGVFPHVLDALTAISSFETVAGEQLPMCLISDYHMPATPGEIDVLFEDYLNDLERLGLRAFFEPVTRHVTLSTHAGVRKPARRIFEMAIERLGMAVNLTECLFITENAQHIAACKRYAMQTLQFGPVGTAGVDFSDWSEAPLLVAHIVAPGNRQNLEVALNTQLAVREHLHLLSLEPGTTADRIRGRAKVWHPVHGQQLGAADGIHVEITIPVTIQLDSRGRIEAVERGAPAHEAVAEATHFVESLATHQQIGFSPGPLPPGATHQVEADAEGRRVLKRTRFSAL